MLQAHRQSRIADGFGSAMHVAVVVIRRLQNMIIRRDVMWGPRAREQNVNTILQHVTYTWSNPTYQLLPSHVDSVTSKCMPPSLLCTVREFTPQTNIKPAPTRKSRHATLHACIFRVPVLRFRRTSHLTKPDQIRCAAHTSGRERVHGILCGCGRDALGV